MILLLGCEFIRNIECIYYFLPLNLIWYLLVQINAAFLTFLLVLSLLRLCECRLLISIFALLLWFGWWLYLTYWLRRLIRELLIAQTVIWLFNFYYRWLIVPFQVPFSLRLIIQILSVFLHLFLLIRLLLEHLLLILAIRTRYWNMILVYLYVMFLTLIWPFFAKSWIEFALIEVFWLVNVSLWLVLLIFVSLELSFYKLIHSLLVIQITFQFITMALTFCLITLSCILWLSVCYRYRWMASTRV